MKRDSTRKTIKEKVFKTQKAKKKKCISQSFLGSLISRMDQGEVRLLDMKGKAED